VRFTFTSNHVPCIGFGTVVDISSKGIAFRAEAGFLPGMKVSASVTWPAMPAAECALQLCIDGRVVRVERSLVAVRIDRYDFRTAGKVKTVSLRRL
jgi:hypothetical protein